MKKKRLIMTAALLSAFCMSAAGCSLYPGNKETQPANASQAETETGDMTPIAIYVVMAVSAIGVIVFVKRRKTA